MVGLDFLIPSPKLLSSSDVSSSPLLDNEDVLDEAEKLERDSAVEFWGFQCYNFFAHPVLAGARLVIILIVRRQRQVIAIPVAATPAFRFGSPLLELLVHEFELGGGVGRLVERGVRLIAHHRSLLKRGGLLYCPKTN